MWCGEQFALWGSVQVLNKSASLCNMESDVSVNSPLLHMSCTGAACPCLSTQWMLPCCPLYHWNSSNIRTLECSGTQSSKPPPDSIYQLLTYSMLQSSLNSWEIFTSINLLLEKTDSSLHSTMQRFYHPLGIIQNPIFCHDSWVDNLYFCKTERLGFTAIQSKR